MSDQHIDPAGNTQQFRAFAQGSEPQAAPRRSKALPVIAVVLAIAIVAVAAFLLLR
jgi:hypothetical protein